jgi:hypothetical protein
LRLAAASSAAACLLAACSGGDLVLPSDSPSAVPAALEAFRGNEQAAPPGTALPDPIVVKVTDAEGNPMAGVQVAFDVAANAGEVTPDTATTDGDGEAPARWVLGDEPGEHQVVAEVVGAALDVVSFTATAVEDAPAPSAGESSITASPDRIEAGSGLSIITVTVRDSRGRPVGGASVTLAASGVGNILTQPSAPTDGGGVAQGTLQGILPGTREVSATVNGAVELAETASVTVVATAEPERLVFVVQPSNVEEDEVITPPVTVAVVGAGGDIVPVSGIEIQVELLREHGNDSSELEGDTTQSTEDGVAVFPDLRVDRDEDRYRLRASAPGRPELGSVDSDTFEVED